MDVVGPFLDSVVIDPEIGGLVSRQCLLETFMKAEIADDLCQPAFVQRFHLPPECFARRIVCGRDPHRRIYYKNALAGRVEDSE
jgi:hypothetical protein